MSPKRRQRPQGERNAFAEGFAEAEQIWVDSVMDVIARHWGSAGSPFVAEMIDVLILRIGRTRARSEAARRGLSMPAPQDRAQ